MSELVVNVGRGAPSHADSPAAFRWHRDLPDYAATPVHLVSELAAEAGVGRVRVKDESLRMGLPSFKILGVSWALCRHLATVADAPPEGLTWTALTGIAHASGLTTLVAATDGNHGRAVARAARRLQLGATIVVPAGLPTGRLRGLEAEAANVSVVPGDYDAAVETAAALGTSPGCLLVADTSLEGYHRIPQWIVEGYSTLFVETDVATAWPPGAGPSVVIVPVGVGSLAQSAVRHYASRIATGETVVVTVEPVDAACLLRSLKAGHPVTVPGPHTSVLTGLNCGTVSLDAWPDLLAGVGIALTVTDTAALAATEDLDRWGIPAGECGGASVAALRALAAHPVGREFLHPDCDVLVLCTEGAAASGRV